MGEEPRRARSPRRGSANDKGHSEARGRLSAVPATANGIYYASRLPPVGGSQLGPVGLWERGSEGSVGLRVRGPVCLCAWVNYLEMNFKTLLIRTGFEIWVIFGRHSPRNPVFSGLPWVDAHF